MFTTLAFAPTADDLDDLSFEVPVLVLYAAPAPEEEPESEEG